MPKVHRELTSRSLTATATAPRRKKKRKVATARAPAAGYPGATRFETKQRTEAPAPARLTLNRRELGEALLAAKKPGVIEAPGLPKLPPMKGTLFVVNKGVAPSWDSQPGDPKPRGNRSSLMVMDLKTGAMERKVPLHDQAHEIEIAPDGRTAVIPHFVWTVPGHGQQPGSQVTVIDLKTDAQRQIKLPGYTGAHGVHFIDDDRVVVTADSQQPETEESFLLELNIRTGELERAIPTRQAESHLVQLSPDRKTYFVSDLEGRFSAIDRASGEVKKSLRTGDGTEGFDISPDGKEIWVAARNDGRVTVLDANTLERKGSFRNEGGPIRLHFMPDGKHVLVTNRDENSIGIIDAKSRLELKEIDLMVPRLMTGEPQVRTPSGAMMIAVVPGSNTAFVANSHSGVVTAIDTKTWELKGFLKAGLGPDPLAYLP